MIGSPLHILWSYIFVIVLDLEIIGTAIAMIITNFIIFIGYQVVTYRQHDIKEALEIGVSDGRNFMEICEYMKIAFPSMTVIFIDWFVGQT